MLFKVLTVAFLLQVAGAADLAKRQLVMWPQQLSLPGFPQQIDDSVCHPEPTADAPQHIIGYDMLINEETKNAMYPGAGESVPIRVRGLSRHWNFQNRTTGVGHTKLGSAVNAGGTINAVAFTIPPGDNITATLLEYDEHHKAFCRQRVPVKAITTFITKESNALEDGDYWTYVTRAEYATTPNPNYPIVQSLVDEFITGCLEIGKKFDIPEFADECVESTYGWEMSWVNDRIYTRRPEVKHPMAPEIDRVLARKAPMAFNRITIE
jgi:hypothetical protein